MLTKLTDKEIKNLPPFGRDDVWNYYTYSIKHDWVRKLSPDAINAICECHYIPTCGAEFYNPVYSGTVRVEAETRKELNQKIKYILNCL